VAEAQWGLALGLLLRQTLVLSLALPLLLLLRPWLRRWGGAGLAYAAWALLPLLMVAASVPGSAPAQALAAAVWAAETGPAVMPRLGDLALPRVQNLAVPGFVLLLWAAGVLAGLWRLAVLHARCVRGLRPAANGSHLWAPAGSGPALVGWLRPQLVLPLDFQDRFTPQQQVLVRCHEAVHQQRGDNTWNLLATGLCLLHWFNPLAWWALRCMRADQELACDAAVMAHHPGRQADYGHALLQAQGAALPAGLPWASWPSHHPLTERIAMPVHLSPRPPRQRPCPAAAGPGRRWGRACLACHRKQRRSTGGSSARHHRRSRSRSRRCRRRSRGHGRCRPGPQRVHGARRCAAPHPDATAHAPAGWP